MKRLILIILCLLLSVNVATAFEVNFIKSGMTMIQAKLALSEYWCGPIAERGERIIAYPISTNDPLIVLSFRKGSLYRYQIRNYSSLPYFTQLVADKRKELGRPVDAWFEPINITSNQDINRFHFLWKNGKYTYRLSYPQNNQNNQMTITYEDNT